ncbi:hypothetical protein ACH4U6_36565 [Streptomyces netropsis]|uniref:hypothetical protein n=1 Tax=Streptomyces netropsis TaxID=55404 RepID=UPI0037BBF6CE
MSSTAYRTSAPGARLSRQALVAGLVATASTAVVLFNPGVSFASGVDLTCAGYSTSTYSPGITFTPHTVHFTGAGVLGPCVSSPVTASGATIVSGTFSGSGNDTLSCLTGAGSGTRTFHWNLSDGTTATSTEKFTGALVVRPGGQTVIADQGTIIDGAFTGDRSTSVIVLAHTDLLACARPGGLRSVSGPRSMTFTGV